MPGLYMKRLECLLVQKMRPMSCRWPGSQRQKKTQQCHGTMDDNVSSQASNVQYTIEDIPGNIVDDFCDILLLHGAISTSVSEYRQHGEEEEEIFKDRVCTHVLQQNAEYWKRCRVQACFTMGLEDSGDTNTRDDTPSDTHSSITMERGSPGGSHQDNVHATIVLESLNMLGIDATTVRMTSSMIRPHDWEKSIKDAYQVMKVSETLWIVPSWEADRQERELTDDVTKIILEPGLAFGTGDHPTTRLCLSWIDSMRSKGIQTSRMLDYGTGSGVLAIAALVMNVAAVADGTDIEPLSVKASRYNASLNNVEDRFNVYLVGNDDVYEEDNADTPVSPSYDIIMANILQGPLVALAPTLARQRRPSGGTLLALSGITRHQVSDVISAYSPWFGDFEITVDPNESDWVLLTATSLDTSST